MGDNVILRDSLGNPYEYRVSEAFVVTPEADWAVDPVRGRDMVTLQTCTFPDLVNRLIVLTDRISIQCGYKLYYFSAQQGAQQPFAPVLLDKDATG